MIFLTLCYKMFVLPDEVGDFGVDSAKSIDQQDSAGAAVDAFALPAASKRRLNKVLDQWRGAAVQVVDDAAVGAEPDHGLHGDGGGSPLKNALIRALFVANTKSGDAP